MWIFQVQSITIVASCGCSSDGLQPTSFLLPLVRMHGFSISEMELVVDFSGPGHGAAPQAWRGLTPQVIQRTGHSAKPGIEERSRLVSCGFAQLSFVNPPGTLELPAQRLRTNACTL